MNYHESRARNASQVYIDRQWIMCVGGHVHSEVLPNICDGLRSSRLPGYNTEGIR